MIRPATSDDLPDLLVLLKQLFSIEEDFLFDAEKQIRGLELLLQKDKGQILVAEVDGRVAGMATGQLLVSTAEGRLALLVEDVVVSPSHQGHGIGPALLEAVGDWGRACGAVRMQLLADLGNNRALEFYKKQKWQETRLICLRKYHEG
jgi:GNAT superfamily N-acetyltransferase